MSSLPALCVLGFLLGMRHASDADHVVAVTTIVSRERSIGSAAMIGILWGIGHTLTILVTGTGIIVLGWIIPPRLGLLLELAVGIMLILLGLNNLTFTPSPTHGHDIGPSAIGPSAVLRPLVVGTVHGLAGSAAVALLVLTTIGNSRWSVIYLLTFGVGTIAGMALITLALAWPMSRAGHRHPRLPARLRVASGVLSVAVGVALAYRIGIVDGLFAAQPRWTPR